MSADQYAKHSVKCGNPYLCRECRRYVKVPGTARMSQGEVVLEDAPAVMRRRRKERGKTGVPLARCRVSLPAAKTYATGVAADE